MATKLKLKVRTKLPAALRGGTGIAVTKDGLTYTLDLDYSLLVPNPAPDGANSLVAIWNRSTGLWNVVTLSTILNGVSDVRQDTTSASDVINAGTTLMTIHRTAPTATALGMPPIGDQGGAKLSVVDYSTAIAADHVITLTPIAPTKIMGKTSWQIFSTATQPGSLTLFPSTDLNDWYIAP